MKRFGIVLICVIGVASFAGAQTLYTSDFESDNGGWTAGDDWSAPTPEWEWGTPTIGPSGANSGVNVWATKLDTNHSNSGGSSWITQTFDFTNWTNVQLDFWQWINSGGNSFDQATVQVNGTQVHLDDGSSGGAWEAVNVDLSAYDGLASVEIRFNFAATTVVDREGWYIDDVTISGTLVPVELQTFTIE